jgi:hypothetical protein
MNQLVHIFELQKSITNNQCVFSKCSFTNVFIIIILMYYQFLIDKFKIMLSTTSI